MAVAAVLPSAVPSSISLTVTLAVLGSAVLHASWNAIAKSIPRLLGSALMGVGFTVGGAVWCTFAAIPAAVSWPYLAGSAALQTGYLLLLTAAYAHGDFGRIYPLARGTAPVLVTAFSIAVLGERLAMPQLLGVALVVCALGALVAGRLTAGARGPLLAVATGVVIASYTLVDGIGVRLSGTATGYAAWQMVIHGPMLIVTCLALAGPRRLLGWARTPGPGMTSPVPTLVRGVAGGLLAMAAYAIVLWAQSRASLSMVSTLRETSVLFAGVLGAVFFAERFTLRQSLAAVGVVAGIALIQLA